MEEGAEQITGFEEFYAEPPMRPDEAEEELALYDPKLSVATYVPPPMS
jgi:Argonaute siRNA chaperone (ARC) complex subunit Arb1